MGSHSAKESIATRLLRLHEALEKVEERSLRSKQQTLEQLVEEEQFTVQERDQLFKGVVASQSAAQRVLYQHQWLGVQARLEQTHGRRRDIAWEVEVQQSRLQAAHLESERWRSFYETDARRDSLVQQVAERRELDEAALRRHRSGEAGDEA